MDQHAGGKKKAEHHRRRAGSQGQRRAPAVQLLRRQRPTQSRTVIARRAAIVALEPQQHEDESQHGGGQLRGDHHVAERQPRMENAGGEGLHREIGHRAEIGQRLHQRERGARCDRRARQRQRRTEKTAPGAIAGQPRRFHGAARLLEKSGTREQVDIGVQGERKHRRRAVERADFRKPVIARPPAGQFAQRRLHRAGELQPVGIGVGHDVRGHRQRQHQRPLQRPPPGEAIGTDQPGRDDADRHHAGGHAEQQQQGAPGVAGQHGAEQMFQGGLAGTKDVAHHDQDGGDDEHADRQGQPAQHPRRGPAHTAQIRQGSCESHAEVKNRGRRFYSIMILVSDRSIIAP